MEYEQGTVQEDKERKERTGVESYDQKLERWKEGWCRELEEDLEKGN